MSPLSATGTGAPIIAPPTLSAASNAGQPAPLPPVVAPSPPSDSSESSSRGVAIHPLPAEAVGIAAPVDPNTNSSTPAGSPSAAAAHLPTNEL